ncbi:hypothetical protein LXA43DRAFT_1026321, partial [Ganoderma leucocontextum]
LICLCTLRLVVSSASDISTCAIYAGNSTSACQVRNFRRHSLPSSESRPAFIWDPLQSSPCSSAGLGHSPHSSGSSISWCRRLGGAHVWVPRSERCYHTTTAHPGLLGGNAVDTPRLL